MSYDPEAFDAFEAAGWAEKDAAAYDMLLGRVTKRFAEPLLDAVEAGLGTRLLDLATGPGYVAGRAVNGGRRLWDSIAPTPCSGSRVSTCPVPSSFTATSRPSHSRTSPSTPSPQRSFCSISAEPERAWREAARVLEPGGAAAFTVWDVPSSRTLARRARRRDRGGRRLGAC